MAVPKPPEPTETCRVFPTICASLKSANCVIVAAGIVAVISRVPMRFGFYFEISRASIGKDGLKVDSFNLYSPISIWTDFMESPTTLPGKSNKGIEADISEALGRTS